MGYLSNELRDMGFVTTGKESPITEDGTVWRKGTEAVCDETGVVLDGDHVSDDSEDDDDDRHRYRHSERVKMYGAFLGEFDWGDDGETFRY